MHEYIRVNNPDSAKSVEFDAGKIGSILEKKANEEMRTGSYDKAEKYYSAAAELGDIESQYILGLLYFSQKLDHKEGLHWLTIAAEQNHPQALLTLGWFELFGRGNLDISTDCFRKALEYGDFRVKLRAKLMLENAAIFRQNLK